MLKIGGGHGLRKAGKRQEIDSPLEPQGKECSLVGTLILVQRGPFWTSELQNSGFLLL